MKQAQTKKFKTFRAAFVLAFFCLTAGALFYAGFADESFVASAQKRPKPRPSTKPTPQTTPQTTSPSNADFPHRKHQMECASCHKFPSKNWETIRKTDAFPDITDYPQHESCLKCHRAQFFSGERPSICTICHTNPSPNDSSRHPFPNPREIFDVSQKGKSAVSDFQISFPHATHIEIVSEFKPQRTFNGAMFVSARMRRAESGEESCAVCHKTYQPQNDSDEEFIVKPPDKWGDKFWLKKGTFKTVPTGHTTCFTCHSQDSGLSPAPTDCGTCHKLAADKKPLADYDEKLAATIGLTDKMMLDAWRKRDSSGTFRHEFMSHADTSCSTCHTAATINTLDLLTKKVAVTSCNGCHITATVEDGGALNYEIEQRKKDAKFECVKCHVAFGKAAIPASHQKALADAK